MSEIRQEAEISGWHIFTNQIPLSRGFPKMMRGDFTHLGNAYTFNDFAGEFFRALGLE